MMPTLTKLAGTAAPDDRVIDGVDIAELIHGKANQLERERFAAASGR